MVVKSASDVDLSVLKTCAAYKLNLAQFMCFFGEVLMIHIILSKKAET